jgi:hypothetical protein
MKTVTVYLNHQPLSTTYPNSHLLLLSLYPYAFFRRRNFFFTYGSFRHLVGLLGRGISPAPRPLPTQDNTNTEKRRHTSMPRAGFEPAIPMFERPKTVLALDREAIETGQILTTLPKTFTTLLFSIDWPICSRQGILEHRKQFTVHKPAFKV